MAWVDSYDNAERIGFYSRDRKLSSGKLVMSFVNSFCSVYVAGQSYFETIATPVATNNTSETTGGVDGVTGSPPNNWLELQFVESDSPQYYNPSDEKIPLFSKVDGV